MKRLLALIGLLVVLLISGSLFFVSMAGEQAIIAYADIQSQPISAGELALQSRQTPAVQDDGRRTNAAVAMITVLVLVVLAILYVMRGGSEFLRQWRLARRRPQSRHQPMPQAPYLPTTISQPIDQLGRAQRPPRLPDLELPAWTETDSNSY